MFDVRLGAGIGHAVSLPALVAVGLLVGYIAGMFGVGGGFLLTPVLMHVFGVPPPMAVGSALCQQCGASIASVLRYRHLKRGEPRFAFLMMGGSLIGVDAGTRLLTYLSHRPPLRLPSGRAVPTVDVVLDVLFIGLLGITAVFIFGEAWQARRSGAREEDATIPGPLVTRIRVPPYVDLPNVGLSQVSVPLLGYLGFVLGLASGLMGIGGGVLFMPVLLYGFGLSARNAAGTGISLLLIVAVVGTVEQALRGYVSLKLAMAVLIGSSIGSQLGALTTHRLPNRLLRLMFASLVAVTVVMIALDLIELLHGSGR